MWPVIGGLVSGGLNLLGGMMGQQSQADVNAANRAENAINRQISQDQFNANMAFQREQFAAQQANAQRNIDLQREFAQHGTRWRVEDAVAAGLSPLAGLGATGSSFAPISIGGFAGASGGGSSSIPMSGDSSMPRALSSMGQDISRAINATRTQDERVASVATTALSLERQSLENDLIRSQIAKNNAAANPPASGNPFLIPGQTQSGAPISGGSVVQDDQFKRIAGQSGQPGAEPGAITDVGFARTATGWAPVPSKDVKERIEDNIIQETLHAVRNNLLPTMGINMQPPFVAPAGKEWFFNAVRQEYQLVNKATDTVLDWGPWLTIRRRR